MCRHGSVVIVTGKGNNSDDSEAKIRPCVMELLTQMGCHYEEIAGGSVLQIYRAQS